MPKLNPYLIPKENLPKTEQVIYLDQNYQPQTYEEFMKTYEYDASLNYDDLTYSDISDKSKGYGPCQNSSCDCYCSAEECICNNYSNYGHGGHNNRYIKVNKKTRIKGFQHLIHTINDASDRNDGPRTARGELWDGDASVRVNEEVGLHSIRSSSGVNAGLGGVIASGGAEYSAVRISDGKGELNFLSGTIGGEAGIGLGGATLGYTLSGDLANVRAGGFSANVGYDAGSGVAIGAGGIEAKVGGVGFSVGKKMGISTPVGGVSVDLEEACVVQ